MRLALLAVFWYCLYYVLLMSCLSFSEVLVMPTSCQSSVPSSLTIGSSPLSERARVVFPDASERVVVKENRSVGGRQFLSHFWLPVVIHGIWRALAATQISCSHV